MRRRSEAPGAEGGGCGVDGCFCVVGGRGDGVVQGFVLDGTYYWEERGRGGYGLCGPVDPEWDYWEVVWRFWVGDEDHFDWWAGKGRYGMG